LEQVRDKVPILRVFATRIRDGRSSRSGDPVRSGRVSDEVLAVSKGFTDLGAVDPRLNVFGAIDKRLSTLYKGMKNQDPPAT
jgi:hypothetical protein